MAESHLPPDQQWLLTPRPPQYAIRINTLGNIGWSRPIRDRPAPAAERAPGTRAEKRYLRKDGEVIWAAVSHSVVRAPDGDPMLIVEVARDITAQRAAEAKVQVINAELEARVAQRTAELNLANSSLEALSYSVAPDLRAPQRALSGYSDALLEDRTTATAWRRPAAAIAAALASVTPGAMSALPSPRASG